MTNLTTKQKKAKERMKKKKIEEEWERVMYIKRICYGYGIPPAESLVAEDMRKLQARYNELSKEVFL